jgi:hypothetical protein
MKIRHWMITLIGLIGAAGLLAGQVPRTVTPQQIREARQVAHMKNVLAQLQAEVARHPRPVVRQTPHIAPGVRESIPVPGLLTVQPNGKAGFNTPSDREWVHINGTIAQSTMQMQLRAQRLACEQARYGSPYPAGYRRGDSLNPGWRFGPSQSPQLRPCP